MIRTLVGVRRFVFREEMYASYRWIMKDIRAEHLLSIRIHLSIEVIKLQEIHMSLFILVLAYLAQWKIIEITRAYGDWEPCTSSPGELSR